MGFSSKQLAALRLDVDRFRVRKREVNGRELSYIEGWFAISEANRIFGFDAWSRETVETKCVAARENRGAYLAVYTARVRITVSAAGTVVIRDGHGTGEGRGTSPGEAHDLALKAAETDATKRALATFGKPFGLALYSGIKEASLTKGTGLESPAASQRFRPVGDQVHIPVNSQRQDDAQDQSASAQLNSRSHQSTAVSLIPELKRTKIDKSVLAISEPKRHRNKNHLRFVAAHSCLVCGRHPADAHHLRFAQPRALGLKVSDEYTVPLCREHHRQLHHSGNEIAWWHNINIKPLPVAKELWMESQLKENAAISLKA